MLLAFILQSVVGILPVTGYLISYEQEYSRKNENDYILFQKTNVTKL